MARYKLKEGVADIFFPHQLDAIRYCSNKDSALVSYTTGSGKSLIQIALSLKKVVSMECGKFFVFVTASSIISLKEDFEKFTEVSPSIVTTKDELLEFLRGEDKIALIKYTAVTDWCTFTTDYTGKRVYCKLDPDIVGNLRGLSCGACFDEVHILKNGKAKGTKACKAVRKLLTKAYGFTATPISRTIEDVFKVADFLCPGFLGDWNAFSYRYIRTVVRGTFKKVLGYKNLEELNERLKDLMITYFPKKEINYINHVCELSNEKAYRDAAIGLFELKEDDEAEEEKQFSARLVDLQYVVDEDPNKIEVFKKLIKEKINSGALVYCSYYRTLDVVISCLDELKIEYKKITGAESTAARTKAKDWFNESPGGKVLLLTKAGGASLNLQSTNEIIMYSHIQNVASFLQLIGRVVRIGSAYKEFNIHMITVDDTVDLYKYEYMLQNKQAVEQVLNNEALPDSIAEDAVRIRGYNANVIDKLKKKFLWMRKGKLNA